MSTTPSTFTRMVVALIGVTAVSAISLGFVYELTKGPIEEARIAKQMKAIEAVLPAYTNDPLDESIRIPLEPGGDSLTLYPGYRDSTRVGTALKTFSDKGYSGRITLMVGITASGEINNIQVLEHKETPGLGSKMALPDFINQFLVKADAERKFQVTKDGGSIDAISGATITSRAFAEAVNRAVIRFNQYQDEKGEKH